MELVYVPLYNKKKQDIGNDAYYIIKSFQELPDHSLKAQLSGMIYVLVSGFLSKDAEEKYGMFFKICLSWQEN
ncbi:hypothetical protein LC087_12040 [Bacillus carboniphilus]|uniref:Uncharacterized protein n=1 Tax=Bacillus carboniphilus TaxID=86663 RepID=A0ABY9JSY7_9BACI|nr:hypothetical protein [Bacillus carboniphilus]WLR41608.1 hypothetical protein LC087_12040 [Bacillus carboniphilus]